MEEGQCCLEGEPDEAGPSRRPREADPASGPHESGRATPGAGHGRPSVRHHVLLLGHSLVTALGASTEASFSNGSELLTVAGVVGVQVMKGAEWSAALG